MKCKVTARGVRENYRNIIAIGYCKAQALLRHETPFAYSAGVYGWNCDYYDINGVCISTGYRPIGKYIDYEKLREAEAAARSISEAGYPHRMAEEFTKSTLANLVKNS